MAPQRFGATEVSIVSARQSKAINRVTKILLVTVGFQVTVQKTVTDILSFRRPAMTGPMYKMANVL